MLHAQLIHCRRQTRMEASQICAYRPAQARQWCNDIQSELAWTKQDGSASAGDILHVQLMLLELRLIHQDVGARAARGGSWLPSWCCSAGSLSASR